MLEKLNKISEGKKTYTAMAVVVLAGGFMKLCEVASVCLLPNQTLEEVITLAVALGAVGVGHKILRSN